MYYVFIINFCIVILKMCTLLNSFSVINTGICFFCMLGLCIHNYRLLVLVSVFIFFFKKILEPKLLRSWSLSVVFFITFYKNVILLEVPKINVLKKKKTSLSLNGMCEFIQGDKSSLNSYMIAGSCGGTAR